MENLEKYAVTSIKSGDFANEVIKILIKAEFDWKGEYK